MFSERAERYCTFIYAVKAALINEGNESVGGRQLAGVTGA